GSPSRSASVGDSVVRGRLPGASAAGCLSSSQNICARVPRPKPSSGITGEDCSQPPDGVADTILPAASTMSKCTVSPRISPMRPTVGSPPPQPPARAQAAARAPRAFLATQPHHRAETLDRARTQFARGLVAYELAPLVVVGIRKERRHRHLGKVGIAVEFFAIGIGELGALDEEVD